MECKQMYNSGLRVYLLDNYNWIDFVLLSLYLSSYVLRFLVDHWIKEAERRYNGISRAKESLLQYNLTLFDAIKQEIFLDSANEAQSYFMKACRSTSYIICLILPLHFCATDTSALHFYCYYF